MASNDLDVAQVLEDAAALYEDEKIEWCTTSWAKKVVRYNGVTTVPVVTMCAEGALLTAAGFTMDQVLDFQYTHNGREGHLIELDPRTYNRFAGARRRLVEAIGGYVTTWNDHMDAETGKERVVETMRTVAKDIRNQAPAEEL